MLLKIEHRTELTHTERVSETVLELRMAPRTDTHQTVHAFGLAVAPEGTGGDHIDWLGNRVHQYCVLGFHQRMLVLASSLVVTHPQHRKMQPDARVDEIPRNIQLLDFLRFQGPVQKSDELSALAGELGLQECKTIQQAAERVMQELGRHLEYRRGMTTSTATVPEVLCKRAGVCQDFTHVALALFRSCGIPARYVSGYLYRPDSLSSLETHAWCEVYAPEAGWVGLDPTHGEWVGERHVGVAHGRSYADVPPNRGVYRGNAGQSIEVAVQITPIEHLPRTLVPPRPAPLEVSTSGDGPAEHRERIDYQQEQQQQQQQQQRQQQQ